MKNSCLIILFLVALFSCQKEEEETDYWFSISGASVDTISVGDTIDIYINWRNSEITENLQFTVQGDGEKISGEVLGLRKDTILSIIIPKYEGENCFLELYHPNGAIGFKSWTERKYLPTINKIYPMSGKAGDLITMEGKEITSGDSIEVWINAQKCEIVEADDDKILFKVPDKSGNGKVKLKYKSPNVWLGNEEFDHILNGGVFLYEWAGDTAINSVIKTYTENNRTYELKRDELGRVVKRIWLKSGNNSYINTYDLYSYDNLGLLDSIKHYINDNLSHIEVYSRNSDNTIIVIDKFQDPNNFTKVSRKKEVYIVNNTVVQSNCYLLSSTGSLYLHDSEQYIYVDNLRKTSLTKFQENGTTEWISTYSEEFDIYNGKKPEINIPGILRVDEYPIIYKVSPQGRPDQYYIEYNDNGKLVKNESKGHLPVIVNAYEYE